VSLAHFFLNFLEFLRLLLCSSDFVDNLHKQESEFFWLRWSARVKDNFISGFDVLGKWQFAQSLDVVVQLAVEVFAPALVPLFESLAHPSCLLLSILLFVSLDVGFLHILEL